MNVDEAERRRLEALAYGRDTAEAERADAAARLQVLDSVIAASPAPLDFAQLEPDAPAVSADQLRTSDPVRVPRNIRPLIGIGLAGAVTFALGVAALVALAPVAPPNLRAVDTRAHSTPPAVAPALMVPGDYPSAAFPPLHDGRVMSLLKGGPDPTKVTSAVPLVFYDDSAFYGGFTDAGQACLGMLSTVQQTGTSKCIGYTDFQVHGITIDRGAWSVTWYGDGSVVLQGSGTRTG